MTAADVAVAVIGGGPAGAALAARLARRGVDVAVFERSHAWHWRACGVFSSPAAMRELRDLGVPSEVLAAVARPIPRLRVEAPGGASFALTYGSRDGVNHTAIGIDRSRLDPCLLDLAAGAGADIRRGTSFVGLDSRTSRGWAIRVRDGTGERPVMARVVVGADGVGSDVARALGVARVPRLPRVGLTFHVPEPAGGLADDGPRDGRMVVLRDAYCGLAPVPGGRVNVGIVVGGRRLKAVRTVGARRATADILRQVGFPDPPEPLDRIAGISPIGQRVTRRAGDAWLLVGDAAGFLDPFTGEGLHRALVSARLADTAIATFLRGRADVLADYDAAMRGRFAGKDMISWLAQLFLAQPAAFDYAARRLASRPALVERMGLLLGDLAPASGAVDPRFLLGILRP